MRPDRPRCECCPRRQIRICLHTSLSPSCSDPTGRLNIPHIFWTGKVKEGTAEKEGLTTERRSLLYQSCSISARLLLWHTNFTIMKRRRQECNRKGGEKCWAEEKAQTWWLSFKWLDSNICSGLERAMKKHMGIFNHFLTLPTANGVIIWLSGRFWKKKKQPCCHSVKGRVNIK